MTGKKPWWQSRTVWGAILIGVASGYNAAADALGLGFRIPDELITLLAAWTLYGRATAKKEVTW